MWNYNSYRGVIVPELDPNPDLESRWFVIPIPIPAKKGIITTLERTGTAYLRLIMAPISTLDRIWVSLAVSVGLGIKGAARRESMISNPKENSRAATKGPAIYDVCTRWGEEGPVKSDKVREHSKRGGSGSKNQNILQTS